MGGLLAAAMVLTYVAARGGSRAAVAALVLESLLWSRLSSSFEGPHLLRLSHNHGVVLADVVAMAGLAAAAHAWRSGSREPASVGRGA